MPAPKPKPMQTPFQNQQQEARTYAPMSIAGTPEAQAYLDVPIDVDPGVGRRTDLAEQEVENRYNSVFGSSVPSFIREGNRARELREVRGRGAAEAQAARYAKNAMELGRRERLLPNIVQTGGSGSASGYGTQIVTPPPGFWHQAGLSLIGGARSAATMMAGAGY